MTVVVTDWREEYAYTLGLQAFIFGFPWVYLPQLRWQTVAHPIRHNGHDGGASAPLDRFWHQTKLPDAQHRGGASPTLDTLSSVAWVDVRREPVILSHPEMGSRYFAFELVSLDSDLFASVGTRSTGSHAGHFAIIGPDWQGSLPPEVHALAPSRTSSVHVVARTSVDGPTDVANVRALQANFQLTPLCRWSQPPRRIASDRHVWRTFEPEIDALAAWKTLNRAMTEDPPEARHAGLLKLFSTIGVGPCQRLDRLDARTKRGLARAAAVGAPLLTAMIGSAPGTRTHGWLYPPPTLGRAGLQDDFVTRAAMQCTSELLASDPLDMAQLVASTDAEGRPFSGTRRYRLHFRPSDLPPVGAFWSLTLYGPDHNFVANSINRYAVSDRTPRLGRGPDGGITLYIQHDPPDADRISNWLPAPGGAFNLILRAYLPGQQILDQVWQPPELMERSPLAMV